jgi:hypothetical protein|tara:strand:+ start:685 stop:867 length:183 start_codon:yes stop_codon:yes gene_type:complete
MKEALIINIKELKSDLATAEARCKAAELNQEYAYWNGVRCQAEVTLKRLQKTFELLAQVN